MSALPAHVEPGHGLHASAAGLSGLAHSAQPASEAVVVRVDTARAFYGGPRPARAAVTVDATKPLAVVVEAVRRTDGLVVARWDLGVVAPGTSRSVNWDGTTAGRIQREGGYTFRARATADEPAADALRPATADFVFLRHRFPVRGPHGYGDAGARFGAGRGFGGHQGQDVFAACGTPVVAARAGVVRFRAFQGRAGNYLVINGARTGVDYVYAHLREPARFGPGRHLFTGQLIGFVGRTGDATACHLHFEMWTGPGWYAGGAPFDPLPWLRGWDRAS